MINRRKSKEIAIGNVKIGNGAPISIQSMCNTDTRDVSATLYQIQQMADKGCELVRLAVLNKDAAEAIKKINKSGYLAIVVTNQPVIARGDCTFEQLQEIHNKMETELGKQGAFIDGIYFCPHHTDKGFEGERPEYKCNCDCRKPKPGMLLKAAEDFNIYLANSWMIGDGENDIMAGKAAECKTALIGTEDFGQDLSAPTLLDAVGKIIKV